MLFISDLGLYVIYIRLRPICYAGLKTCVICHAGSKTCIIRYAGSKTCITIIINRSLLQIN